MEHWAAGRMRRRPARRGPADRPVIQPAHVPGAGAPAMCTPKQRRRREPSPRTRTPPSGSSRPGLSSCPTGGASGVRETPHRCDSSSGDFLPTGEPRSAARTGSSGRRRRPRSTVPPPDFSDDSPAGGRRGRDGPSVSSPLSRGSPASVRVWHADPVRTPPPLARDLAKVRQLRRQAELRLPSPLRTPVRRRQPRSRKRESSAAAAARAVCQTPPVNVTDDLNESLRPCCFVFDSPDGKSPFINGHKVTEERGTPSRCTYPLRLDMSGGDLRDLELESAVFDVATPEKAACYLSPAPSDPPPPPRRADAALASTPVRTPSPRTRPRRLRGPSAAAAARGRPPLRPLPQGVLSGMLLVRAQEPASQVPAAKLRHVPAPPRAPPPARLPPPPKTAPRAK